MKKCVCTKLGEREMGRERGRGRGGERVEELTRLDDFLRSREMRRGDEAEGNPPPERDRW